jgi:hypothetical protein
VEVAGKHSQVSRKTKPNVLMRLSIRTSDSCKGFSVPNWRSEQAENPQFVPQSRRQIRLAGCVCAEGEVGRCGVRLQVAPTLERLGRPTGKGHQDRIKNQPGAGAPVVTAILDDVNDALADQHAAVDYPVHRAAVDHLPVPARKASRAVAQRWTMFGARCLKAAQLFNVAHAHSKLGEMQHGRTTRASPVPGAIMPTGWPDLNRDDIRFECHHLVRAPACLRQDWV